MEHIYIHIMCKKNEKKTILQFILSTFLDSIVLIYIASVSTKVINR